ncbi:MAG: hypothetical protein MZV64_18860 [Ignavibacteriales bacterium]|nr:hypothetical protein [Ignavibacteriales bacterium]
MNGWGGRIGEYFIVDELINDIHCWPDGTHARAGCRANISFNSWTTAQAAAPMFDISGRLLGVLRIVMPMDRYHIHSLGLLLCCTCHRRAASVRFLLVEQNSQLARLNAILSKISDGILVWKWDMC